MSCQNRIKEIDVLQEEIAQQRPLKPRHLRDLKEYYRIGLTYSSNALEGNSLTETETKVILEDGITIGGKTLRDHFEVIGHSKAYDLIFKLTKREEITERDILKLHKLFYYLIDVKKAGKYRKEQVFISGTNFIPPAPNVLGLRMKEFAKNIPELAKKHPVEYAALIHLDFVTIHPFVDGNGRTARLLMNLALLQKGFVVTIIPPILRSVYIDAIKQSQVGTKDKQPFINFISNVVYESQKEYLRLVSALIN